MTTTRHLDAKQSRQEEIALAYQAACEARRGKRHGVVVTPVEVVDHQVRSVLQLAQDQHGPGRDTLVRIRALDPFGGTGIYLARLIQLVPLEPCDKIVLASRAVMVEIDPDACQAAVANLRAVMAEETGQDQIMPLVCQADTYTTGDEVWDMTWRLAHLYRRTRAACEEASA